MSIDFDQIRRDYDLPSQMQKSGDKIEKDGNEYRACCPFHKENTPSFTLYKDSHSYWKYHCFGCGAHGDVIDYVQERYSIDSPAEAVKVITGDNTGSRPVNKVLVQETRNPYDGYKITRPPKDAPKIKAGETTPPLLNPKRVDPKTGKPKLVTYEPSMVFPYKNKNGDLIGYVLRVEFDDKKITPGIWWTENKDLGWEGWSHGKFPAPRPLYKTEDLHAHPDRQVLIVEGEKCADAAKRLFSDKFKIVTVSWMGGGKALSKVHWRSLAGRSVLIWPDNDEEGWKTALGYVRGNGDWVDGIVGLAHKARAKTVKVVHITKDKRPKGWDIADAETEGLLGEDVAAIIRDRVRKWEKPTYEKWKKTKLESAAPRSKNPSSRGEGRGEKTSNSGSEPDGPNGSGDKEKPASTDVARRNSAPEPFQRGFNITKEDWRKHLIMKADGEGLKSNSLQNAALILQYDDRFENIFCWNDFAKEVFITRRPPWERGGNLAHWTPRPIQDRDVSSATMMLEHCGMSMKVNDIWKVVEDVALGSGYNPVVERMDQLAWDGVPRVMGGSHSGEIIEPWLTTYFGAANTSINMVFGLKWLISACARAYNPGSKVDTMLILEGEQGRKKSSAVMTLANELFPGIFTDQISKPTDKDTTLQINGKLVVEIAELDAMRKSEVDELKAWIARQTDRIRPPYGKMIKDFPRSCVFIGTVNPSGTGYLKDPTGARRFWPVRVDEVDIMQLKRDATQLWAEAVHLYKEGYIWWLEGEEEVLAKAEQEKRYQEDPWAEMINEIVERCASITLLQIMEKLDIPKERRNHAVNARVASHLHSKGWRREVQEDGRTVYKSPDTFV